MSSDVDALCALLEEYKNELNESEEKNCRLREALAAEQKSREVEKQRHNAKVEELTALISVCTFIACFTSLYLMNRSWKKHCLYSTTIILRCNQILRNYNYLKTIAMI